MLSLGKGPLGPRLGWKSGENARDIPQKWHLAGLEPHLEGHLSHLKSSWGHLGVILGPSWPTWGHLGAILAVLGAVLGSLGAEL